MVLPRPCPIGKDLYLDQGVSLAVLPRQAALLVVYAVSRKNASVLMAQSHLDSTDLLLNLMLNICQDFLEVLKTPQHLE